MRSLPRPKEVIIISQQKPIDLVVIGLGYVGLPLAKAATQAGMSTVGLDMSERVVAALNGGASHVDDISAQEVRSMLAAGFRATTDSAVISDASVVVICVPTPLSEHETPDLTAVDNATSAIASHLTPGTLVILESTTYPGTTEERVLPALQAGGLRLGSDFRLAYSPERIDPGNTQFTLYNTPKVIGGCTPRCTKSARLFYERFVAEVVEAKSPREAEMCKILENTYRQVNIALANEMAILAHELKIDIWDTISCASSKPFGFSPFYPGPGVGGHCIPVDPGYLAAQARSIGRNAQLIELAQSINNGMPRHISSRAADLLNSQGRPVNSSRILLLGATYKPDIADLRESPAIQVVRELQARGADVCYWDPYVPEWTVDGRSIERVDDYLTESKSAAITILLQPHRAIDLERLVYSARSLFDTRGATRRYEKAVQL